MDVLKKLNAFTMMAHLSAVISLQICLGTQCCVVLYLLKIDMHAKTKCWLMYIVLYLLNWNRLWYTAWLFVDDNNTRVNVSEGAVGCWVVEESYHCKTGSNSTLNCQLNNRFLSFEYYLNCHSALCVLFHRRVRRGGKWASQIRPWGDPPTIFLSSTTLLQIRREEDTIKLEIIKNMQVSANMIEDKQ